MATEEHHSQQNDESSEPNELDKDAGLFEPPNSGVTCVCTPRDTPPQNLNYDDSLTSCGALFFQSMNINEATLSRPMTSDTYLRFGMPNPAAYV